MIVECDEERNKEYIDELKTQMEFYFSDVNLVKDSFLRKLLSQHKRAFVDLSRFLKFNRIKEILERVSFVERAELLALAVE